MRMIPSLKHIITEFRPLGISMLLLCLQGILVLHLIIRTTVQVCVQDYMEKVEDDTKVDDQMEQELLKHFNDVSKMPKVKPEIIRLTCNKDCITRIHPYLKIEVLNLSIPTRSK